MQRINVFYSHKDKRFMDKKQLFRIEGDNKSFSTRSAATQFAIPPCKKKTILGVIFSFIALMQLGFSTRCSSLSFPLIVLALQIDFDDTCWDIDSQFVYSSEVESKLRLLQLQVRIKPFHCDKMPLFGHVGIFVVCKLCICTYSYEQVTFVI